MADTIFYIGAGIALWLRHEDLLRARLPLIITFLIMQVGGHRTGRAPRCIRHHDDPPRMAARRAFHSKCHPAASLDGGLISTRGRAH